MPHRTELHLTLVGLVLAVRRLLADTDRHGGRRSIVLLAVMYGALEGRPLDIGSIARMTGFPRATAIRFIAELEREGLVASEIYGRRRVIIPHMGKVAPLIERIAAVVIRNVSKMDKATFDRLAWPDKADR